jgi:hypothetical protein
MGTGGPSKRGAGPNYFAWHEESFRSGVVEQTFRHRDLHWRNRRTCLRSPAMIVIRRLTDRQRAYTAIFLPGEEPRVFPTTDYEHGRILQIFKQDRPYDGVCNDFTDFLIGQDAPMETAAQQLDSSLRSE